MKNPLTTYGLFGRNYWHLIKNPSLVVTESYCHVKWFIQRGYRGYADCDVWSLDSYISRWMPEALTRLQKYRHGRPMGMTSKGWDSRLEKMKDGFLSAREILEANYSTDKEYKQLERRLQKGLKLFSQYFLSLWD